jgi:hypothetical protein
MKKETKKKTKKKMKEENNWKNEAAFYTPFFLLRPGKSIMVSFFD